MSVRKLLGRQTAAFLLAGTVVNSACAQTSAPPANQQPQRQQPQGSRAARQIPFPAARGGGPLHIAIDGLSEGTSRVGAGLRPLGLCWAGGDAPYRFVLRDNNASPIVQKNALTRGDFTSVPESFDLKTGSYAIELSDNRGNGAAGRFTVVPESEIPVGAPASDEAGVLSQASALSARGPMFDYEAYLRLLGIGPGNSEAQRMLDDLCQRPAEAEISRAPGGIFNTEIILADAADLSSGQFAGAGFYYAYLTKQGAILSEAVYEFESSNATTFDPNSANSHSSSVTQLQQTTTLFEYGLTDDFAVGAEISAIFETYNTNPPEKPSPRDSDWSNPTFLTLYRVIDQSEAPATAFLRASYSPHIVKNSENVADAGASIIREQGEFAFGGIFDATYTGPSPTIAEAVGKETPSQTVQLRSDWRYHFAFQSQNQLNDQWFLGVAVGYQFAYNRDEYFSPGTGVIPESERIGGTPFVSASAGYVIIPDLISASLTYQHFFNTNYQINATNMLPSFTRASGADAVTLVLSSTVSVHDLHLGLWQ